MIRSHVVVDGSNIATEGRSTPSLHQLDEAVRAFIAEHPTDHLTVVVDATFGHRIDSKERPEFDEAVASGELITAPAGAIGRGDAFILHVADRADATVLSNDSFQEFHGTHTWLFDEGRLIGGKPVPGVGWVFLLRTPVRGPTSRKAVKDAKDKGRGGGKGRGREGKGKSGDGKSGDGRGGKAAKEQKPSKEARDEGKRSKAKKVPKKPAEAANEPLPFIEFVGAHPVGSMVEATVDRFSSHGAYVTVDGATCYVPLRLMGDPAPRSAREVLTVGEVRQFAVHAIDAPRRGIDLALVASRDARARVRDDEVVARSRERDDALRGEEAGKANIDASARGTTLPADPHAEEAPVTPAKKAASKRAAKKTTAKKAAKKAPAKRTAKKAAKKAPAKRTAKKAAKRAPAKRTAKKTTAKRTAKKAAKKAPAKRTAKKAAKKAPAKRTAKKATRKAPARRR